MKTQTTQDTAAQRKRVTRRAVSAREQTAHRFLLIADMLEDRATAFPEAWRSYGNVAEARLAAGEMMRSVESCGSRSSKTASRCSSSNGSTDSRHLPRSESPNAPDCARPSSNRWKYTRPAYGLQLATALRTPA